jgi:hypothetical protein
MLYTISLVSMGATRIDRINLRGRTQSQDLQVKRGSNYIAPLVVHSLLQRERNGES